MANQIIIDIGAVANDGTGDPLRTAFGYVNNNFSNIWATGVANSNIAFSGNKILTTNTNGNLVLAPNGIGKVQSNVDIVPNANNTLSLGSLANQWNTVYAQNLSVDGNVAFGDLTVDGNLTVNGTTTTINTANVDIEDKMITLAFGSSTANLANGAGINVAGADANITYLSTGDKWSLNKDTDVLGNLAVSDGSLTIAGPLGNIWSLDGDRIISPAGGSWESIANTEYFSSGINGFVHINSFDVAGNIVSTIDVEHSFIQFNIYDGINAQWSMNNDGTTGFPNYAFPYEDGNANEVLVSDGNGTLAWTVTDTYGNANVAAYLPTYTGNISAAYINVANNVNIINDVFAMRGTFTGDPVTGDASMYVGSPTFTVLGTDVMAQFTGNVPNYAQINLQNYGNSNTASGDYIITADNGTDSTHFVNLGITNSTWDGSQPNSLGNRLGPNDGYLYVQDGDFVLGTVNGNIYTWKFDQDGTLTVAGDIVPTANNTQTLGSDTARWSNLYLSGNTIYLGDLSLSAGPTGLTSTTGFDLGNSVATDITANVLSANAVNIGTGGIGIGDDNYLVVETLVPGGLRPSNDDTYNLGNTLHRWAEVHANVYYGDGSQLTGLSFTSISNDGSIVDIPVSNGDVTITANSTQTWAFGTDGTFDAPGNITTTGNISGGNLISSATIYGNVDVVLGNIANVSATKTRMVTDTTFSYIQTGNGTVGSTGNIVFSPYSATTQQVVIDTASGNLTATGNISGGNILGNGSSMTGVATMESGAWTVTPGTANYSFTVPVNGVYQLWVRGNIPNGIITYTATVSVTNSNVPVIGQQFAWNYEGAGNPILLTSIPSQIIGTAGAISNASPVVGTTTNTFEFGINNATAGNVTVEYGYTKLS